MYYNQNVMHDANWRLFADSLNWRFNSRMIFLRDYPFAPKPETEGNL
jgi:hypothetical protein